MNRQGSVLFEAPLAHEMSHYANEFEWELQEGTHYGPAFGEGEWKVGFYPYANEPWHWEYNSPS